jgi:hypothetical protein
MKVFHLKTQIITRKNEAVERLVNGNHEDLASVKYLQGTIHGLIMLLQDIKEAELKQQEIEEND